MQLKIPGTCLRKKSMMNVSFREVLHTGNKNQKTFSCIFAEILKAIIFKRSGKKECFNGLILNFALLMSSFISNINFRCFQYLGQTMVKHKTITQLRY